MNDTAEKILSSQEVIDYLLENPDFFLENQGLFTKINFPHESSGAISLIERQVQVLRQDQKASKETVAELAANAAANHDLLSFSLSSIAKCAASLVWIKFKYLCLQKAVS
jgi:uncharacterized protein YigA (DUF484 family)